MFSVGLKIIGRAGWHWSCHLCSTQSIASLCFLWKNAQVGPLPVPEAFKTGSTRGPAHQASQAGASGVNSTWEEHPTAVRPFSSVQKWLSPLLQNKEKDLCIFVMVNLGFCSELLVYVCLCVSWVSHSLDFMLHFHLSFFLQASWRGQYIFRFHREGKQVLLYWIWIQTRTECVAKTKLVFISKFCIWMQWFVRQRHALGVLKTRAPQTGFSYLLEISLLMHTSVLYQSA